VVFVIYHVSEEVSVSEGRNPNSPSSAVALRWCSQEGGGRAQRQLGAGMYAENYNLPVTAKQP